MQIPKMLPIRETSELTGLSYDFLRKLCLEGRIVFVKAGAKNLINVDRLVDYLNSGGDADGIPS